MITLKLNNALFIVKCDALKMILISSKNIETNLSVLIGIVFDSSYKQ